jgi:uncharacterized protein YlaI
MAFCDNPKCRFKDCNGAYVRYIKMGKPRMFSSNDPIDIHAPLCDRKEIEIKSNLFIDTCTEKPIKRFFCDECKPLVDAATEKLKYWRYASPVAYKQYLIDHGDNLLLHFVQSEWFAREDPKKKSPF